MSYGLIVNNDKGYKVFDSNELPYIFTVINEPMVEVRLGYLGGFRGYVYDIHDRFTEAMLVAVDTNHDGYNYRVDLYNGRWHIILTQEGSDLFPPSSRPLPKVYVMDRLPSAAATGYGIECRNEVGDVTLSSRTPLPQIVGTFVVTTVKSSEKYFTTVGTLGGNLLVIESSHGESISGYQNLYPGGGSTYVTYGEFVDWRVVSGQIQVCDGGYDEEMGQGGDYYSVSRPVRFTIVKRP